jgi:hypothetical protein
LLSKIILKFVIDERDVKAVIELEFIKITVQIDAVKMRLSLTITDLMLVMRKSVGKFHDGRQHQAKRQY